MPHGGLRASGSGGGLAKKTLCAGLDIRTVQTALGHYTSLTGKRRHPGWGLGTLAPTKAEAQESCPELHALDFWEKGRLEHGGAWKEDVSRPARALAV